MTARSTNPADIAAAFVDLVGRRAWAERLGHIIKSCEGGSRTARANTQRHVIEVTLERSRRQGRNSAPTTSELAVMRLASELLAASRRLTEAGRGRLRAELRRAMTGEATLMAPFHIARVAAAQRSRGFAVGYLGFDEAAPFDLMLARDGMEAEAVCDAVSAEEGRTLHRGAWVRLVDAVDPDLQTWLDAHPGRYLLKLTLPQGLRADAGDQGRLSSLHARIRDMLGSQRRADHDEAAVLRLDPLMLAGSQADELGLLSPLRREFGHEAHLAVTASRGGVFVMAARAGQEDQVAVAIRRRMSAVAPARLTGARPGILAMLIEDTDATEWRHLRDRLVLEGEARRFLTRPEAKGVVAVTCISRIEMLGEARRGDATDGELRFRNPAHPAAREAALAAAVLSAH